MKNNLFNRRGAIVLVLLLAVSVTLVAVVAAAPTSVENKRVTEAAIVNGDSESEDADAEYSHRLIVELASPSVISRFAGDASLRTPTGMLDLRAPAVAAYQNQLEAEQAEFISRMNTVLPGASVANYIVESGESVAATYQLVLNAVAVEAGEDVQSARKQLAEMEGVKAVFHDYAYSPDLYASLDLINAPALWDNTEVGGRANAGAGVKVASVDTGLHHEAPMLDGTGFDYPPGYPKGYEQNTNGKIIVSRAYFRPWDPPVPGDSAPWPGPEGSSHGVHTASTAVGNIVTDATYLGAELPTLSGVAPGAWAMSYKIFYSSLGEFSGSAFTVEIVAAIEDAVLDGADVINNSWGGGPTSIGGDADPLDEALINAVEAGVFVSMSAGNAGPGLGTGDHPSEDYMNVAASTDSGNYAAGQLNVTGPEPVSPTLQAIPFGTAAFGPPLPLGMVSTFGDDSYLPAAVVAPGNATGCDPFAPGTFEGTTALIARGTCFFATKVFNAQEAGAEFVILYNNVDDDSSFDMAFGCDWAPDCGPGDITIPSIGIGHTYGIQMIEWYEDHGASATIEVDTVAFQAGDVPDRIANFSSRGPGVGSVLKPDIAAPGVSIMAQGYDPAAEGEAVHLGYGQVSGTSMAAPHVAGAAAVILQAQPDWSPHQVKSAMMTTAKFMDIYNLDGTPAQPLDMGAGRLDLAGVTDPGVFLTPTSLGYGYVMTGTVHTMTVNVTSAADSAETYQVETLYTGDSFTMTTSLPGFSVNPTSITLAPGETETIEVTFDTATSQGIGENQGYVVLDGSTHEAHFPVWARVMPPPESTARVLVIDNDASTTLDFPDYSWYYTSTLENLGISYDYLDADQNFANPTTIPEAAVLATYEAIIYFTGDNFYPDGTFTVATPLTPLDMDRLVEYANQGGAIIAMGQDATAVLDESFFQEFVLGAQQLQDSVTDEELPELPIVPFADAPPEFDDLALDVSGPLEETIALMGGNEVPPVNTTTSGEAIVSYDIAQQVLSYDITITTEDPVQLTGAHIHTGTVGVNGPVLYPIFPFTETVTVTDTVSWDGQIAFSNEAEQALLAGNLYINVHSVANTGGEIRGQLVLEPSGDGAANQYYIDELETQDFDPEQIVGRPDRYVELFRYPGPAAIEDGTVGIMHRRQPTLEFEEVEYLGRSIFTSFGLEGVNNGLDTASREELMQHFLNWAFDEPEVSITVADYPEEAVTTVFSTTVTSNISGTTGFRYRWDFGDGTGFFGPYEGSTASHNYDACGTYTVRVEVVDSWGNVVIGEEEVEVMEDCQYRTYLPFIAKE